MSIFSDELAREDDKLQAAKDASEWHGPVLRFWSVYWADDFVAIGYLTDIVPRRRGRTVEQLTDVQYGDSVLAYIRRAANRQKSEYELRDVEYYLKIFCERIVPSFWHALEHVRVVQYSADRAEYMLFHGTDAITVYNGATVLAAIDKMRCIALKLGMPVGRPHELHADGTHAHIDQLEAENARISEQLADALEDLEFWKDQALDDRQS